jgi:hypothetical protein
MNISKTLMLAGLTALSFGVGTAMAQNGAGQQGGYVVTQPAPTPAPANRSTGSGESDTMPNAASISPTWDYHGAATGG